MNRWEFILLLYREMLNDTSRTLVVDYSYDFIADDGLLTCGKPGQNIEDFIVSYQ